jgi:hypothetical protein
MRKNNFLDKFKKVIWILTPFILLAIIIILLIQHCNPKKECFDCDDLQERIDNIELKIKDRDCLDCDWENIDDDYKKNDTIIDGEIVQKPTNKCRAHFTGALMNDSYEEGHNSLIFKLDKYSEYVGEGEYPRANIAFPKSHTASFDGIAIDKSTRVIIYSKQNFKGNIVLDITGPAIINNILFKGDPSLDDINNRTLKSPYEGIFPKSCRQYSKSDMRNWSNGSLKVICNE